MRWHFLIKIALMAVLAGSHPAAAEQANSKLVWGDNLPGGLDPHVVFDTTMQFYMLNAYDNLYRYEDNPPKIVPWLAENYTTSPDGLTWTFTLKGGVTFHDGSELTANDVVYSFQRVFALGRGPVSAFRSYLKPTNVTAPDKKTVKFTLDTRYAPFLSAIPLVSIVNEKQLRANEKNGDWGSGWLSSNEAGSGAYQLDPSTYRPQEIADLRRFSKHFYGWKDNSSPVETVQVRPVKEASTRVLALLRGDIDSTDSYLPTDQVDRVSKTAGVRVAKDESMRVMVIRLNNKKPPFDNVNFRRCMSYAFNYKGFISSVLKDFAVRNYGPIPNNLWGTPANLIGYDYDLKKAKAACDLAKSEGAPIDRQIELHVQAEYEQTNQAAQVFQNDVRALGLNMKIVPVPWANLASRMQTPANTPDMWIHWVSTYFVDPENWIGQMYDSQFHGSWKASSWYTNSKVDNLLRTAREELDQERRKALYEEASRIVVNEAADIWIYNTVQLRGLSDRVAGYKFSPVSSGGEIRWMSVKPR
jgi:peptide/nickel transport system substrate-binding protein